MLAAIRSSSPGLWRVSRWASIFTGSEPVSGKVIFHREEQARPLTSHSPPPPSNADAREGGDSIETMRLAIIRLEDGEEIPCVVRELSLTGAKLSVSHRYRLPESFDLLVRGRRGAFPVQCTWQRGNFACVVLSSAIGPDA